MMVDVQFKMEKKLDWMTGDYSHAIFESLRRVVNRGVRVIIMSSASSSRSWPAAGQLLVEEIAE
jgi:hypothetical protein